MAASLIKPSSLGLAVMGNHPPGEEVAGLLSDSSSPEICHLLDLSLVGSRFYYCRALRDSTTPNSFWLGSKTQFIPNICYLVEASLEFWNNNWLKAHGNNHAEINRQFYNYTIFLLLIFCLLGLSLSHSSTAIIFVNYFYWTSTI